MDKLPFFYYDILSRITPGATALATLFLIGDKMPPSWHSFFVEGEENWKAVVVPLLLGGLCYVIGVLFEAVEHLLEEDALVGGVLVEQDQAAVGFEDNVEFTDDADETEGDVQ